MTLLIALALAAAPVPAAANTPSGFVTRLYAGYRNLVFSPFRHAERIFAPRLLSAIREDQRLAKGEVGYLDGDPLCQCQDSAGLKARIVAVRRANSMRARVSVTLGLQGERARPAQLSLVRTRAGWRIADVSSPQERSLLAALEASNRKLRR